MRHDNIIIIGDKVELVRDAGRVYKTKIEDATGNGFFLVSVPSYGGLPVFLHVGDDLSLSFSRESGRYTAKMTVMGFEKRGEIRYAWLLQKTKPQKDQRRGAYRLPVNLRVMVYEYTDNLAKKIQKHEDIIEVSALETVGSKNISITGIELVVKRKYEICEKILLKPHLGGDQSEPLPLIICAEVVRLVPERYRGTHSVGTQFFGQTKSAHDHLTKYVLTQQQKQIRQNKFLDRQNSF